MGTKPLRVLSAEGLGSCPSGTDIYVLHTRGKTSSQNNAMLGTQSIGNKYHRVHRLLRPFYSCHRASSSTTYLHVRRLRGATQSTIKREVLRPCQSSSSFMAISLASLQQTNPCTDVRLLFTGVQNKAGGVGVYSAASGARLRLVERAGVHDQNKKARGDPQYRQDPPREVRQAKQSSTAPQE